MKKIQNGKGFSLAETLMVVAIMTILMSVGFVAVQNYMRSMTKLEYDGYAKEIFIAAQNHLSMAKNLGYLGMDEGEEKSEGTSPFGIEEGTGIYYFAVNTIGGSSVTDKQTLLSLMLPTAAVEETVRLGGKYIIRYRPEDAVVLDVFYWSDGGRYAHTYVNEYSDFLSKRGDKDALKTYESDQSVIGWYGGEQAALLTGMEPLEAPAIVVRNAERLTVTVTDPNTNSHTLRLIIRGVTSGAEATVNMTGSLTDSLRVNGNTVILDDVTSGMHFSALGSGLIPGEDIEIRALAEPVGELRAPAYSATATTNSLFGDGSDPVDSNGGNAKIMNIRHLENLSKSVSNVNTTTDKIKYTAAEQAVDLNWTDFKTKLASDSVQIVPITGSPTKTDCFMPVTPEYALQYDGKSHKISEIQVDAAGDTGLFGELIGGTLEKSSVADLTLVDFSIKGGTNAGALAGTLQGVTVRNVLAYNTGNGTGATITGSDSVGGLIGSFTGGSVTNGASALVVSGGSKTGGLIGASSGTTVTACYSGAHTKNGSFVDNGAYLINVSGSGSAGGLIGSATGGSITDSYSTCSVSGTTAGGLAGTAGGTIKDCYSVGLVQGTNTGVFVGSSTASFIGCAYLDIASYYANDNSNYTSSAVRSGSGSGVSEMDANLTAYRKWVPETTSAKPYDTSLGKKYPYKPNSAIHYGDWPTLDTGVVN